MATLNQIVAIEKGAKSQIASKVTEIYHLAQKAELFNGFVKTYEKINDQSEDLPEERKRVQHSHKDVLRSVQASLSDLFQITARKDWTNCSAKADVVVNGVVMLPQVPVTYLLFLEKQLVTLRTFVTSLPVLDNNEDWEADPNSDLYKSQPTRTHRTKKNVRPIVKYDATDKHPAQTEMISVDELVGHWKMIKQSGAIPKPKKEAMLDRIETLSRAVKAARTEANSIEEIERIPNVGSAMFGYIFGDAL